MTLDSIPNNGTILVIEDDPRMQKVLKRLFAAEGYAVEGAADGKLGIDAFHSLSPSAVVLDLMLPGLPGREVCKRIKGASPNTPIHDGKGSGRPAAPSMVKPGAVRRLRAID